MNYLIKVLSILCLLSGASCASNQPRIMKNAPVIAASPSIDLMTVKLPRIASVEHLYTTTDICTREAQAFYDTHPQPGPFAALPVTPLTYSFRDDTDPANPQEIRFTVQAAGSPQPNNTIVNYWEIKRKKEKPKDDIDKAIDDLEKIHKCKKIRGPVQDSAPVNGKYPWRAIMETTEPIDPPETLAPTAKISGTFGIIVNPPIP